MSGNSIAFHSFSVQGARAKGEGEKFTHAGQKTEVNKAENTFSYQNYLSVCHSCPKDCPDLQQKMKNNWGELCVTSMTEDLSKVGENRKLERYDWEMYQLT